MFRSAMALGFSLLVWVCYAQDAPHLWSLKELQKQNPSLVVSFGVAGSNPFGDLEETALDYQVNSAGMGVSVMGKSIRNNSNFLFGLDGLYQNFGQQRVFLEEDSVRLNFNLYTLRGSLRFSPKVRGILKPFAELQAGVILMNYRSKLLESTRAFGFREKLSGNGNMTLSTGVGLGLELVVNPKIRFYVKSTVDYSPEVAYGHQGSEIDVSGEVPVLEKSRSRVFFNANQLGISWTY